MSTDIARDEEARMEIMNIYTMNELLECPETCRMIWCDYSRIIDSKLTPVLEQEAARMFHSAKEDELNILEHMSEGQFVGGVSGLVLNHIKPRLHEGAVLDEPTVSLACLRAHFAKRRAMTQK